MPIRCVVMAWQTTICQWKQANPFRRVNADLDAESVKVLRAIPGFETIDPVTEVLHNGKPGTGVKGTPDVLCCSSYAPPTGDIRRCR